MSRASRCFRITGKLIKAAALSAVFGVIIVLLWRIFSSGVPYDMKALTPNDDLAKAYSEYGKDLYIFSQDQKNITTAERNKGYFSIIDYKIIPEANQIQLVFRYNNSTIRKLAEDYSLATVPSVDDLLFDVSICLQTDLTPNDNTDNAGNIEGAVDYIRVKPQEELTTHGQKTLYNYYRYVFDLGDAGVSLSELLDSGELLAVYADIYYNGDVDYEKTPYGTLCLYDYVSQRQVYRLSGRDCKAIEKFSDK